LFAHLACKKANQTASSKKTKKKKAKMSWLFQSGGDKKEAPKKNASKNQTLLRERKSPLTMFLSKKTNKMRGV